MTNIESNQFGNDKVAQQTGADQTSHSFVDMTNQNDVQAAFKTADNSATPAVSDSGQMIFSDAYGQSQGHEQSWGGFKNEQDGNWSHAENKMMGGHHCGHGDSAQSGATNGMNGDGTSASAGTGDNSANSSGTDATYASTNPAGSDATSAAANPTGSDSTAATPNSGVADSAVTGTGSSSTGESLTPQQTIASLEQQLQALNQELTQIGQDIMQLTPGDGSAASSSTTAGQSGGLDGTPAAPTASGSDASAASSNSGDGTTPAGTNSGDTSMSGTPSTTATDGGTTDNTAASATPAAPTDGGTTDNTTATATPAAPTDGGTTDNTTATATPAAPTDGGTTDNTTATATPAVPTDSTTDNTTATATPVATTDSGFQTDNGKLTLNGNLLAGVAVTGQYVAQQGAAEVVNEIKQDFPGDNTIRFSTSPSGGAFTRGADGSGPESVTDVENAVNTFTAAGFGVIIDNHGSDANEQPNVTTDSDYASKETGWFTQLATDLKSNPDVMYQSGNEPIPDYTNGMDSASAQVVSEQQAMYNAVRSTGSNQVVAFDLIGGGGADALQSNPAAYNADSNYAIDVHAYTFENPDWQSNLASEVSGVQSANLTEANTGAAAPMYFGEVGTSGSGPVATDTPTQYDQDLLKQVTTDGTGAVAWLLDGAATGYSDANHLTVAGNNGQDGPISNYGQIWAADTANGAS